jgi:hypothetical protein
VIRRFASASLFVLGLALPLPAQVRVGDFASDFTAKWLNHEGGDSLSELRGRVVLLEFWRTW